MPEGGMIENQTPGMSDGSPRDGRLDPKLVIKQYEEAKSIRSTYEADWRVAAAYCLPQEYQGWLTEGPAFFSGNKHRAARRIAYDSTGMRSLPKWTAIIEAMITPMSQHYHGVQASNPDLMKIYRVKLYFDELRRILFQERYRDKAKYTQTANALYSALGCYGSSAQYITERRVRPLDRQGGIHYRACRLRDIFILLDDDGNLRKLFRRAYWNARQFVEKFPDLPPEQYPRRVKTELQKKDPSETTFFQFIQVIGEKPEDEVDPEAFDQRRFPLYSDYLCVDDGTYVGERSGYLSWPYIVPRISAHPEEPYGLSPAQRSIPAMGSASAAKKSYLKLGQRAADQVLLAHNEVAMGGAFNMNPDSINFGAINAQGRPLVQPLPTGEFRVAEQVLQDERADIEDNFLVHLFQILTENPQMTAREVVERSSEKASLLAPTMGMLQSEHLGPQIEREIDILANMGRLPEMPPELVEAQGDYEIIYTSPLAMAMYSQEVGGFLRAFEIAAQAVEITQDPRYLDHFDLDDAIPDIATKMSTPARYLSTPQEVIDKRDERAERVQRQQLLEAAPAIAGVAKAVQ